MSRDWETHLYSEPRPLTAARVEGLLARLAAANLPLYLDGADRFPVRDAFVVDDGPPRLRDVDVEDLLRSRPPPRGNGYGVLPLRVARPELPAGCDAFLRFGVTDAGSGLEITSLAVDGALFAPDEAPALDAAFEWLALLSADSALVYGWADWETAVFLQAAPSRREARAGLLPRLMRFNALGPDFLRSLDRAALRAQAERWRTLPDGTVLFQPRRGVELATFT